MQLIPSLLYTGDGRGLSLSKLKLQNLFERLPVIDAQVKASETVVYACLDNVIMHIGLGRAI